MKYCLGIDIGGTKIAAGVVDASSYRLLAKSSLPTGAQRPFLEVVADIGKAARTAIDKAGLTLDQMYSIGVGTPSCINPRTGLLVFANAMGWSNAPLKAELTKEFSRALFFANDADCAALGESLAGAAKDADNVVMVTLGTGVGGGVILNSLVFNGCDQMGAEIGHMTLVFEGEACSCGKQGCFEAYASGSSLVRQTLAAIAVAPDSLLAKMAGPEPSKIDGQLAFAAARKGDPTAARVVDRYISYVAAGTANLITIFRPEIVVVGGGVCEQGNDLLVPLNAKISQYVFAYKEIGAAKARAAVLGNDAGIIGAAMLESHMQCYCRDDDD